MEIKEVLAIGLILVGVFALGFSTMTGKVINESEEFVECNIADFNGDGILSYSDRIEFGKIYAADYASKESCSRADLNEDGKISGLDNSEFGKAYNLYKETSTSNCILKKLACAESEEIVEESGGEVVEPDILREVPPAIENSSPEKIGFFQKIKDFFKRLFGK